ncbi:subclass B1 metallo-beta-lactamase [Parasedimentitalea maritima]|uniref:beta-lactamase n=2 Tax=Parasedimentitalea maritima TaxID=2578117 RepID=A0A6A4RK56_9RHOB|nr:subclass B1 metallo-beta-lactamase [Zongyanglinia marina]
MREDVPACLPSACILGWHSTKLSKKWCYKMISKKILHVVVTVFGLGSSAVTADTSTERRVPPVKFLQLSETVWMHTSYKVLKKFGAYPSNGLVVVDGANSILIDSAWTDAQTTEILDWARNELGHPVKQAIFTHAHSDKMGGVGAVQARGIETHALALSNQIASASGLMPAEFDLTLNQSDKALNFGPVEVFYPGAGHSADNLVAYIPEAEILFGGCLIRSARAKRLGNIADANLMHWGDAVGSVQHQFPEATLVVPGHGEPSGAELLELTLQLVTEHGR